MEGGGVSDSFRLGDISDYKDTSDLYPISSAALVGVNFALAATRIGGIGGFSLNTFFDTFGLEGILANVSIVVILFQIARWAYTSFYSQGGVKEWSPIVFISILIAVQLLHDMIFYYGAIQALPSGKNEMIDVLKKYAAENGSRALTGHSLFLVVVGVIAMFLKESSMIFSFIVLNVALYLMPLIITTLGPKPPPPPPPAEKKEAFGGLGWNGPRF